MSSLPDTNQIGLKVVGGMLIALFTSGFAENIRKGYPSCSTCHVSPAGGGILTQYGRTAGSEFMPMFGGADQSDLTWGIADQPDWLLTAGGDLRYLVTPSAHFPMQADFEVGATYGRFTAVGMVGLYGKERAVQTRRGYVRYQIGAVSLRYGRFLSNYGINIADHSRPIRRLNGYDQGGETLNAEVHYSNRYGEVTISRIVGRPAYRHRFYVDSYDHKGWVGKIGFFFGKRTHAGIGYKQVGSEINQNGYIITGYKWIYGKFQLDKHKTGLVGYNELGIVPYRGLHLVGYADYQNREYDPALGFKLYPLPHLELTGRFSVDNYAATAHYYW